MIIRGIDWYKETDNITLDSNDQCEIISGLSDYEVFRWWHPRWIAQTIYF